MKYDAIKLCNSELLKTIQDYERIYHSHGLQLEYRDHDETWKILFLVKHPVFFH